MEKLNETHLFSSMLAFTKSLAKSGKAHLMLRAGASRRKTKAELIESRQIYENERRNAETLRQVGDYLNEKHVSPDQLPKLINKHEQMLEYMKNKDLISSFEANINVNS